MKERERMNYEGEREGKDWVDRIELRLEILTMVMMILLMADFFLSFFGFSPLVWCNLLLSFFQVSHFCNGQLSRREERAKDASQLMCEEGEK